MTKYTPAKAREAIRQRDLPQAAATLEHIIADARYTIRDRNIR